MDKPATTEEIIQLKQQIIRDTPNSGAHLNGKDLIFFMKTPGVDAYLFNDGTVVRRDGFGTKKGLRQYGDFKKSYQTLTREGYRPYGIFAPGVQEQYEQTHKDAKEKISKSQDFFPYAEKIKFTKKADRLGYDQISLQQPTYYARPQIKEPYVNPLAQTRAPSARPTPQNNNDSDYAKLFQNITNANRPRQPVVITDPTMDIAQYAKWNNKMFGVVLQRRAALFKQQPKNAGGKKVTSKTVEEIMSKKDKLERKALNRQLLQAQSEGMSI
jgi:hypothetical protein